MDNNKRQKKTFAKFTKVPNYERDDDDNDEENNCHDNINNNNYDYDYDFDEEEEDDLSPTSRTEQKTFNTRKYGFIIVIIAFSVLLMGVFYRDDSVDGNNSNSNSNSSSMTGKVNDTNNMNTGNYHNNSNNNNNNNNKKNKNNYNNKRNKQPKTNNASSSSSSLKHVNPNDDDRLPPQIPIRTNYTTMAATQIQNYKNQQALMLNIHITHHAGTTFCGEMKTWGETPVNACNGGPNWDEHESILGSPMKRPWTYEQTPTQVNLLKNYFHMISWEFGPLRNKDATLQTTNWEYENLLSVYITRHPIDRLLSGDRIKENGAYVNLDGAHNKNYWWDYAKNSHLTNNYALNILTHFSCVDGANTTESCLEEAKALASRFTFVIDQECLNENIAALSEILDRPIPEMVAGWKKIPKNEKMTARERIGYDDVYDYLVEQNKMDIAFYEWSKERSLVRCSDL